jgi:hypothetical protein
MRALGGGGAILPPTDPNLQPIDALPAPRNPPREVQGVGAVLVAVDCHHRLLAVEIQVFADRHLQRFLVADSHPAQGAIPVAGEVRKDRLRCHWRGQQQAQEQGFHGISDPK